MTEPLAHRRERLMGPNVPTFYDDPVHITRGEGVWLWDAEGRRYLDCYNNVPHVGHCHPQVVEAIATQAARLNCHNRYPHTMILDYIERLTATMGHDLRQMIFTCTGSEANDIALRLAWAATGKRGVIATDTTYHGNTLSTSQLSTRRPPIGGYPDHVRLIPAPSSTAPLGGSLEAQPQAFAAHVDRAIAELEDAGIGFGAMMLCPIFANEGLPDLKPGFFDPAAKAIRAAGGLILCDEVQSGFGRTGGHMWGHNWLGFTPDVVTLGKAMGNGYPVAGLVTRPDLMAAFRNAFGYFNTTAGTPVAAAAALAVLNVMDEENLQANAARTGAYARKRLSALDHPLIAQVRGLGLSFALDLRHADGAPASDAAHQLTEVLRNKGVLLNRIGRHMNIIKMRPPMPFTEDHADIAVNILGDALAEVSLER